MTDRRALLLVLSPLILAMVWAYSPKAWAAVERLEAETVCTGPSPTTSANYSGGAALTVSATVTCPVTLAADGTVSVFGRRDSFSRGVMVSVDGGTAVEWSSGTGSTDYQSLYFTTGTLSAGAHTLTFTDGPGSSNGVVDFLEATTADPEPTPTPTPTEEPTPTPTPTEEPTPTPTSTEDPAPGGSDDVVAAVEANGLLMAWGFGLTVFAVAVLATSGGFRA